MFIKIQETYEWIHCLSVLFWTDRKKTQNFEMKPICLLNRRRNEELMDRHGEYVMVVKTLQHNQDFNYRGPSSRAYAKHSSW